MAQRFAQGPYRYFLVGRTKFLSQHWVQRHASHQLDGSRRLLVDLSQHAAGPHLLRAVAVGQKPGRAIRHGGAKLFDVGTEQRCNL